MTFTLKPCVIAASCIFALAGCSTSTASLPTRTVSGTPVSSASTSVPLASPKAVAEQPEDWTPDDSKLSPAEWESRKKALLAEAGLTEADLGSVKLIRVVPLPQWPQQQVACLKEAGFAAAVRKDGGLEYGKVPAAQGKALNVAAIRCELEYAADARGSKPLPLKRAKQEFHWLVATVKPCVEKEFSVHVDSPPTEEVWLASYYARGQGSVPWHPYRALSDDQLESAQEKCPEQDPTLYES